MKDKHIELIARGVCLKKGHILLCRNRKHGNVYLPGGHIDWGEDSKNAVEREWKEELGVLGKAGRFLGVIEQTFQSRSKQTCEISFFFEVRCAAVDPAIPPASAEKHIEFFWAPLNQLRKSDLLPAQLPIYLPKWLAAPQAVSLRWIGYP